MTGALSALIFAAVVALAPGAAAQTEPPEQKVRMKDMPAAVQKAVQEQTAGARIKGLAKEIEDGQTFYEAETVVNGRTRDVLFDVNGRVVEVEEQILLSEAPAPVRAALAGKGKLLILEKVTKGDRIAYEAHVSNKGKTTEIVLDAAGKPAKL